MISGWKLEGEYWALTAITEREEVTRVIFLGRRTSDAKKRESRNSLVKVRFHSHFLVGDSRDPYIGVVKLLVVVAHDLIFALCLDFRILYRTTNISA